MADILDVEILEDGRIKVTTDAVSVGNHRSADQLLKTLEQLMGGEVVVEGKTDRTAHHRGTSHDVNDHQTH